LRLSEFPIASPEASNKEAYSGKVWELRNGEDEKGEGATWRLVNEFYLPDVVGEMFEELKGVEKECGRGCSRILGFHPYVEDTVFLKFGEHIMSCNLMTHKFKATKYDGLSLVFYPVFPLLLPWWPTPIPLLPLFSDL
jgi:hypothetical protein